MKTHLFITILVLIVIGFAVYIYVAFLNKPKVPKQFFTTYEENDALTKSILAKSVFNFTDLGNLVQTQDYPGALQFVTIYSIQTERNKNKFITLSQRTAQLKIVTVDIADAEAKEKASKIISLLDQQNTHIGKLLAVQQQLFFGLKEYYENILLKGGKEQQLNIDTYIQNMQFETKNISQTQFQLDQLYQELKKIAGTEELIGFLPKSSFTVTPEEEIVVTKIPLVTPTIPAEEASASATEKTASESGEKR